MRYSRLMGWSLVFLCSCKFQASCGNNDGLLNTKKGEKVIAEWLEKQSLAAETIHCPQDIKMAKDSSFICKATIADADGLIIDISVAQTNDDGDVQLSHASKILPADHVERGLGGQILDQTGEKVNVNCGARARLSIPGSTFPCTVTGAKETFQVEISVQDETGAWQAKRL